MPRGIPNRPKATLATARQSIPEGMSPAPATSVEPTARQEQVRRERRRRDDGTLDRGARLKLAIPANIREANPDNEFRWVNDTGNRIYDLTKLDDWDKVDGMPPVPVGTDKEGKPILAHLCKKPTEFYREDQARKAKDLREREKGIERGGSVDAQDDRSALYSTPGNKISPGSG